MGRAVSLREPETEGSEGSTSVTMRIRDSLVAYIDATLAQQGGKDRGRTRTAVVEDAIKLDRDLSAALGAHRARLRTFARGQGLDLDAHLVEVLAQLALAGLDSLERKRR